jgi:hypothetical protein
MAESIPPDESMPRNRLPVAANIIKYHLRECSRLHFLKSTFYGTCLT